MNVQELIEWLQAFPDKEAIVNVVAHSDGTGYYDQGGWAYQVVFDPDKHVEYYDWGSAHPKDILLGVYKG